MFRIDTLQRRFVLLILVPVALLMLAMGMAGFVFARRSLLNEWEEATVLKLQRQAHLVDMRLARPKEWIHVLQSAMMERHGGMMLEQVVLQQLRTTPGVVAVTLTPLSGAAAPAGRPPERRRPSGGMGMMGGGLRVTPPRYDAGVDNRTVSLISTLNDRDGRPVAELEVTLDFHYLLEDLPYSDWYEKRRSFLVDQSGRILTSTAKVKQERLGMDGNRLESATLKAMQHEISGTVRGPGNPPQEVSGFFRLQEAPWDFVVFASGQEILATIIGFRNIYFLTLGGFIIAILVLIRRVTSRTAAAIRGISAAAQRVARGDYAKIPAPDSRDEIGELTRSFNTMVVQLRERMRLKHSLDLAKEVQQNLIPHEAPHLETLDIAGRSRFCDETGGDYYDYILDPDDGDGRLHVIVGDVAGHGVASALLMASVRSSVRQRQAAGGTIGAVLSDVNRQISQDVGDSGRFMTLFYLAVNLAHRSICWVRAGHDPAVLYRRTADDFEALKGQGLPLGVDPDTHYDENLCRGLDPGDIILVATDGIWECRNPEGEMFGKRRWREVVRQRRDGTAADILAAVFQAVDAFTRGGQPRDDMTLIVLKAPHGTPER